MGLLSSAIRTAVISALGAKLARGRSPIVAALMMLLVSKALSGRSKDDRQGTGEQQDPAVGGTGGLGGLIEKFRQGGLEDVIKSWIGTGPNKQIAPNQMQHALGPDTVARLERETGMPRDDLLTQLSRLLPEVIDKLTPNGNLPNERDLLPELDEPSDAEIAKRGMQDAVDKVIEDKKKEPIGTKEAEEKVAAYLNEAAHRDTKKS
jgi:uncharacterized protein YidB (DUF937 family)